MPSAEEAERKRMQEERAQREAESEKVAQEERAEQKGSDGAEGITVRGRTPLFYSLLASCTWHCNTKTGESTEKAFVFETVIGLRCAGHQ